MSQTSTSNTFLPENSASPDSTVQPACEAAAGHSVLERRCRSALGPLLLEEVVVLVLVLVLVPLELEKYSIPLRPELPLCMAKVSRLGGRCRFETGVAQIWWQI